MYYAPHYYLAVAPQMYVNPARSPSTYEHWPSNGSYGYPYPVQCHGCCSHNYFPGHFATRPPYNHVPPSPYYPCHSAVEVMYPAHYIPPHYTMELPRYDYDKDMSRGHHCCGCPNHPCNREQGNNVMIEEEQPEVEKKINDSVAPLKAKNYPYPVVWLQPSKIKVKENKKSDDSVDKGWDRNSCAKVRENSKSAAQQPIVWSGWFPYDMSNRGSSDQIGQKNKQLHQVDKSQQPTMWNEQFPYNINNLCITKQDEEQVTNQHQKDDKWSNFPFPIFWMPYRPGITERDEANKKTSEQEPPLHIKFPPVKHGDTEEKQEGNTDGGPEVPNTNNVQKTISVRQLEHTEENKTSSNIGDKKSVEGSSNRQSSSPRKQSKLPPVCLRVDPLPKRKSTNGGSRSPSPPGDKRNSIESSSEQPELIKPSNVQENTKQDLSPADDKSDKSKKVKEGKGKEKPIPVTDGAFTHDGKLKLGSTCGDNASHVKTVTNVEGGCNEDKAESDVGGKRFHDRGEAKAKVEPKLSSAGSMGKEDCSYKDKEIRNVKMPDLEAASIIQAAFRGFQVRKWEPLKKLKMLAEVKEQMEQIKNRLKALEASCDDYYDEEKCAITEMIMSLLLKLDAVQGLQPSIRDVRKSLAKELVSLQESLDALIIKKFEAGPEQASKASCEDILPNVTKEDDAIDGEKEEKIIDNQNLPKLEMCVSVEPNEKQDFKTYTLPIYEDVEDLEAMVGNGNLVDQMTAGSSTDSHNGASDATLGTIIKGDAKECVTDWSPMKETSHEHEAEELRQLSGSQEHDGVMSNSEDPTTSKDREIEASNLLSQALLDEYEAQFERSVLEDATTEVASNGTSVLTDDEMISKEEQMMEGGEKKQQVGSEQKVMLGSEERKGNAVDILGEGPSESHGMAALLQGEKYSLDSVTESEKVSDNGEPDQTDLSGCFIHVHEGEIKNINEPMEVLREHTAVEGLAGGSLIHDAVQDEPQNDDHGEPGFNFQSGCEVIEARAPVTCEDASGSREHHLVNDNICPEENDHGSDSRSVSSETEIGADSVLVSGGINEVAHSRTNEVRESETYKSEVAEVVTTTADEIEGGSAISDVKIKNSDSPATAQYEDLDAINSIKTHSKLAEEGNHSLPSSTASQASMESDLLSDNDLKLIEEKEKLREMMEKLIECGSKQLNTISSLSERINDLEKRLSRKKKLRIRRRPKATSASGSLCLKSTNNPLQGGTFGLAM